MDFLLAATSVYPTFIAILRFRAIRHIRQPQRRVMVVALAVAAGLAQMVGTLQETVRLALRSSQLVAQAARELRPPSLGLL